MYGILFGTFFGILIQRDNLFDVNSFLIVFFAGLIMEYMFHFWFTQSFKVSLVRTFTFSSPFDNIPEYKSKWEDDEKYGGKK